MKMLSCLATLSVSLLVLVSCGDDKKQATQELETSGYQSTPADFLRAAENGDMRALELFIKQGVDLGTVDDNGWTALHLAASAKRQESVSYLLDAGMDISTPGLDGVTALMLAAREGHYSMVRYLLKQGAKPELRDGKNRSALILAIDGNHAPCIEEIAPYSRNQLDTALLYAAAEGKHGLIGTLTSFGASVYVRHQGGMTPLMLAAEKGHIETVKSLLENGANRYAVNEHRWTAAQVAEAANHTAIARLLSQSPGAEELALEDPAIEEGIEWTPPVELVSNIPQDTAQPTAEAALSDPPVDAAGPTDPGIRENTKPAKQRLPFIAGKTIAAQGAIPQDVASDLTMLHYRENPLPLVVEETTPRAEGGSEARVRMLYGEQKQVTVREGESIPATRFKVISIRRMLNHSKVTDGKPTDVSVVEIEDTATGKRRNMTAHIPATAAEPWAVLRSKSTGHAYAARAGQQFRTSDGEPYTITDVRPNQIIISHDNTGEATTILLGRGDEE